MMTRDQAKALGEPRYRGKPCLKGHGNLRYTASGVCVECRNTYNKMWNKRNNVKYRMANRLAKLKTMYNLTPEEYVDMIHAQDFSCAICEESFEFDNTPCVDHCHTTGVVRGLLCHSCNLSIGRFKDCPDRLMRAAEYVKNPKANTRDVSQMIFGEGA